MLRTGHSSTKGVRAYKRTSEQLLQETSDVLNKRKLEESEPKEEPTKKPCVSASSPVPASFDMSSMKLPQIGFNISSSNITFNVNMPNN